MVNKEDYRCKVCGVFEGSNVRSPKGGGLCIAHAVTCRRCEKCFIKEEIDKCDWCFLQVCESCGPLPDDCLNKVRPPGHEEA